MNHCANRGWYPSVVPKAKSADALRRYEITRSPKSLSLYPSRGKVFTASYSHVDITEESGQPWLRRTRTHLWRVKTLFSHHSLCNDSLWKQLAACWLSELGELEHSDMIRHKTFRG